MLASQSSEIEVATLIEILPIGQPPIYAQNWCKEPYIYCGKSYEYCAFEAQGTSRSIDMANGGQSLTIENASAFDALKPIRDLLVQGDGWRKGRVRVMTLFPDYPDDPPLISRTTILNTRINGATIEITARSPIEAVNCRIPTSNITNQKVPELPRNN